MIAQQQILSVLYQLPVTFVRAVKGESMLNLTVLRVQHSHFCVFFVSVLDLNSCGTVFNEFFGQSKFRHKLAILTLYLRG